LALYRAGDPRRFRNRVDPQRELRLAAASCCVVLAAIAVERGEPAQTAVLLGEAERLRAEAGAPIPALQHDDADRARRAAIAAIGSAAFAVSFERGQARDEVALGL
jgi:hypothetical protein